MGGFGLDGIHLQQIYPINGKVGTGWYSSPAGYITDGKFCDGENDQTDRPAP